MPEKMARQQKFKRESDTETQGEVMSVLVSANSLPRVRMRSRDDAISVVSICRMYVGMHRYKYPNGNLPL
jgi:hypothetical protein